MNDIDIIKKFKFVGMPRKKSNYLDGIKETHSNQCIDYIEVANWNNWDKSFWIKIHKYNAEIVLDSGVIEELYQQIQELKCKVGKGK